jgi:hypothetical protein
MVQSFSYTIGQYHIMLEMKAIRVMYDTVA